MTGATAPIGEALRAGPPPVSRRQVSTPLVDVTPRGTRGCTILAKLEALNPGLSVKDRVGRHLVERSMAGMPEGSFPVLVEASSGNTAIGVAMAAFERGLRSLLFVPEDANPGRLARMRAFGAEVVLTPSDEGTAGARARALAAASADPELLYLDQHSSVFNPEAHMSITGPELIVQLGDLVPDSLVISIGTGGTILGLSRALSVRFPGITPKAVIPAGSTEIPGMRRPDPSGVPLHAGLAGLELLEVDPGEAAWWSAEILRMTRVPVGPSSGAAMAGASRVGEQYGGLVLTLFPDHGFNYV
jgi:cysteine synthase